MSAIDAILQPFFEYAFMRQALLVMALLSLSAAPLGVLLVLKRLSLVGDTLSHAMLPGVAGAFALFGMNVLALSIGAMLMAVVGGLLAGLVARKTALGEDASFAAFYLISLAAGVCLMAAFGNNNDILHFLFGNLLAVPDGYTIWLGAVSAASLLIFALGARGFLAEAFDPAYVQMHPAYGKFYYVLFLGVFVVNLVVAFFAIGTLLAMAIFLLPAIISRIFHKSWQGMILSSLILALVAGWGGLLLSFYANLPAGPAIVLVLGIFYFIGLLSQIRSVFKFSA
jgi:zinc/manganese transport system permease protein